MTEDRERALDELFAGQPDVLSVEEVADLLRVTRPNVYTWLKEGVIPGYKLGPTWRVVSKELRATMAKGANSQRVRPAGARDEENQGD